MTDRRWRNIFSRKLSYCFPAVGISAWPSTYGCWTYFTSSADICSTGKMKSTSPVSIALLGMLSYFAWVSCCTMAIPPSPLMAFSPSVPSVALPERIMQIALLPRSSASERKKASIGRFTRPVCMGSIECSVPFIMATFLSGRLR